ncbi:phasin family protein [Sphingomonas sp. MMS24-J45]|uniref:phasin family protein n=1 Tax=Sphingomonas sp. MMS24-J45 TaxID=3238806 RepID=UPI0038505374
MASKGPKSDATTPAAKPVVKAAAKPVTVAAPTSPVEATAPVVEPVEAKSAATVAAPKPVPVVPKVTTPNVTTEAKTPAPAPAVATLKKEVTTMENTIKSAAEKVQAQATTLFGDVNERAKTAMEKGSKMFEDMNEFSKGNVEALVELSKIAAKGAEEIAKYTTDYVKTSVEKATATAKQFAGVKSPTELFALQSEHAKSAMDSMMAETAKFTENYLKLLGDIAQPISNRVAVAAEKLKIAA